jgi:glycosyltransferase involved in cell wall biosynthesis
MKLLHIITRLDMGGSAQNTLLSCLELSKKNYDVVLAHGLSRESRMTDLEKNSVEKQIERAKGNGLRVIAIPSLVRRIDPVRDIKALWSLWRLIIREKPTIVHTHTSKAGVLGRLAAKLSGVPYIVHTTHGHVFYGHFKPAVTRVFLLMETFFASITAKMVALTEGERNDLIKYAVCKPDKLLTIHSGVEIDRFLNARVNHKKKKIILGLNPDRQVVGTVGWLLPVKGPEYLLNAMGHVWHRCNAVELVFVGKGQLEQDLKNEASRMGVSEKVKFLGWRDDIHEIIPIFDVFVLPSLNEGMGRVLVEAMASGRPIVASHTGGIPDMVIHEQTGLLVSPADESGLADAIHRILKDPEKAKIMGQKGKVRSKRYSVDSMVAKLDALYTDLINNGN